MASSDRPDRRGSEKSPVAVALRYDATRDTAPRVVAKGKGKEAEDILRLAFANDIKVREDADLAALLQAVELDQLIPLEAFTAVAEILSYLYRLNGGIPPAVREAARREQAAG
ncbi:MAG: EscU/YscU/HrcU family type III secretion system export apparatus switch protein [Alphaproteobacteria bacterium]|nr:EscU/YscU/HrcU family type III secretion system export apparatus switch protein [Alphaproteobacteria bacterium]